MSNKIECFAIDTYRHNYLKVNIFDLNVLKVIPLISEYSFVGTDEDDILNEWHFAYLETDCDWEYFLKAAEFAGKEVEIDYTTLQKEYDERYEDHNEWIDTLGAFCEENISGYWGIDIVDTPEDLKDFVMKSDEEEFEEEDESASNDSSSG
jgi:hypothetical protein